MASDEWRRGWPLVLASAIGFSFFTVMPVATGLFMEPLHAEFGWNRTLLSSGTSLATVTTALFSPVVGMLIDRYGARRLVLPGLVLTTFATAGFSQLSGSVVQWFALWFILGLVTTSIKSTGWTTAVVSMFTRSRGLALGFTLSGYAIAQTLVPPVGEALIERFGWREAFVWIGLGWGSIATLFCVIFFFDLRDRARVRRKANPLEQPPEELVFSGISGKEALRNSALWRVAISNFVVMSLTTGLAIHLIPIITESGISRSSAAWLASIGGIAGLAGKLVSGVLLDRFRPNWVGGITLAIAAIVFALLMDAISSPTAIVIAMIVNGFTFGTKTQLISYLTAGYSGMKNFGLIYSVMAGLMALAAGTGPLIAGIVYDLTGGYEGFLVLGALGCLLGAALMASLPRYPDWDPEGRTPAAA